MTDARIYKCYDCQIDVKADEIGLHACFQNVKHVFAHGHVLSTLGTIPVQLLEKKIVTDETEIEEEEHTSWTDAATNLLVDQCLENKHLLKKKNIQKKFVWKKIEKKMEEYGYNYNAEQINVKWKGLLRRYRRVKDINNTPGKKRNNWSLFSAIEELIEPDPIMTPPVIQIIPCVLPIANSSSSQLSPESPPLLEDEESASPMPVQQKRKADESDYAKRRLQLLEESNVQKRRFNDLFEKFISCMNEKA